MARSGDRTSGQGETICLGHRGGVERRPGLCRMFATWRLTVCGLTTSRAAISRSFSPCATNEITSRSRADNVTAGGSPRQPAGVAGGIERRTQRTCRRVTGASQGLLHRSPEEEALSAQQLLDAGGRRAQDPADARGFPGACRVRGSRGWCAPRSPAKRRLRRPTCACSACDLKRRHRRSSRGCRAPQTSGRGRRRP